MSDPYPLDPATTDPPSGRPGATVAVPTVDPAAVEAADPEVAAAMVTNALAESKAWLSKAMEATDPTPIAAFKAWAATVAEATKQKKLGREIELDAAEIVRRAERGLGQAVRTGQERGEINSRGDGGWNARKLDRTDRTKKNPEEFLRAGAERSDAYAMSDDVEDEQFDAALADAREEENLSRANVVRKTRAQKQAEVANRWDQVAELARRGHTSDQIAAKLDLAVGTVRRGARDREIAIHADEVVGRTRRLDSDRIVNETVRSLAGVATGLELIDFSGLDPDRLADWTTSASESMRTLRRFTRQLKQAHQNTVTRPTEEATK